MAKKRSSRMRPVQEIAAAEEQDLSRSLSDAELTLEEQLNRLEQLRQHRDEYAARHRESGTVGGMQWRDYRMFLDRLNQAILSQERIVESWRARRDGLRQQWQLKRQRLESLDKIIDRYRRSELLEEERREQRVTDSQPPAKRAFGED